jgi:hypothetical protein
MHLFSAHEIRTGSRRKGQRRATKQGRSQNGQMKGLTSFKGIPDSSELPMNIPPKLADI